jgi:hypothetical protein
LLDQEALWYLVLIGSLFGWELSQMVAANVARLRKRSPEGFETARSIPREEGA